MMDDYTFGNFLYSLRKNAGISQSQLADQLGVTNKAVSKWETGKSKPTTNTLRKMAALFGLSIDELLQIREHTHLRPKLTLRALLTEVMEFSSR